MIRTFHAIRGLGRRARSFWRAAREAAADPRRAITRLGGGYDAYWARHTVKDRSWEYGIRLVDQVFSCYDFQTVLDAGCGTCAVVRELRRRGKSVRGIELSSFVLDRLASDLLADGTVVQGSLCRLPFPDDSFDLITSFDVLEHIPENEVPAAARELVRVARRDLFMTISLRPSSDNNRYHCTLKSREWWEGQFRAAGAEVNEVARNRFQGRKPGATVEDILREGPAHKFLNEMRWFWEQPPFDYHGEAEPWYFVFTKTEGAA